MNERDANLPSVHGEVSPGKRREPFSGRDPHDFRRGRLASVRAPAPLALLMLACALAGACAITPVDLNDPPQVERLFNRKCGACHAAPAPNDYAPHEWPDIVDDNALRANLTRAERNAIEAWVIGRCRAALAPPPAAP